MPTCGLPSNMKKISLILPLRRLLRAPLKAPHCQIGSAKLMHAIFLYQPEQQRRQIISYLKTLT
jgi:hypothetical protein